jgi:hypothetical protein
MVNTTSPTFLSDLRKGIVESYDFADLQVLCADMGIQFGSIAGNTIDIKALELINYLKRRGLLEQLLEKVTLERPAYPWPTLDDSQVITGPGPKRQTAILFLASDPTDQTRLRIGEEFREIKEKLQLAKERDRFKLELPQLSARPADISQALLDAQPGVVHFSGHGASEGALVFENQAGQTHLVEPDALAALFEQFAAQVKCVVLNACFSEIQAKAIARHIDNVIGMNQGIGDKAAIAFSVGFYQALGAGKTVEEAYKLGCVQIGLQGIPERLTPVLIKKEKP